jgi:hypothetical protein
MTGAAYLSRALAKHAPDVRTIAKAALDMLRVRLPGATELVYDNYALTIAFSPTERPSHAVVSITLYSRWLNLGFLEGAALDDPAHVLLGSGSQYRHIRLASASDLDTPAIAGLIDQAVANGDGGSFDPKRRRQIDVRTASAKPRSRLPGSRRAPSDTASPRRPRPASRPRGRSAR